MRLYIISSQVKSTSFEFTVLAENRGQALEIVKHNFPYLKTCFIEEEKEMLSQAGIVNYTTRDSIQPRK